MTTAMDAKAIQQAYITDLETVQGPTQLSQIYGIIEDAAQKGQNRCEVIILPALKHFILAQLFSDGYTLKASDDGLRITIKW